MIPVFAKYALIMIVLLDADLVITMITTSKRLYEVIPAGARYKQLGRATHFLIGHQNLINEAEVMVVRVIFPYTFL